MHTCQALVVSCMDFRLRNHLRRWTKKTIREGFDRVAIAGGVKNLAFIIDQVDLSQKLHQITEVYLINHEDCGAYGQEGTLERHQEDLLFAYELITRKFKGIRVIPIYLTLTGEFINVPISTIKHSSQTRKSL